MTLRPGTLVRADVETEDQDGLHIAWNQRARVHADYEEVTWVRLVGFPPPPFSTMYVYKAIKVRDYDRETNPTGHEDLAGDDL